MNALFVSNDPTAFDPSSATRARLRAYAAAIGELHFLSRGKGDDQDDGPLHLHPVHGVKLFALMGMEKRANELIRQHGIEVVSAQDPFEHGRIAMKAVAGTNAKLHIQIHTDFLSPWFTRSGVFRSMKVHMPALNRIRVRIADQVLPSAHGIRVVSERIRESLAARYPSLPPVSVIPVSVEREAPEALPLPDHGFSFAFVTAGRLEPEKRIEDILMALGKIAQRFPSVGLVIIGDGSEHKKLETLAKKLGLSARVVFAGEQGTKAWGMMRSAHAYIQASAYEGYGRTLIEAALARLPIITTDVGIVGEVFKGYEQVLATPPGDTQNLAALMTALISDQQLRRSLVLNAEAAVQEHLAHYPDQPRLIAEDLAKAVQ